MKSVMHTSIYLHACAAQSALGYESIYSTVSGSKSKGYQVLVRDDNESRAKQLLDAVGAVPIAPATIAKGVQ